MTVGNSGSSAAAGSTVFDFTVNLYTMAWEAWVVPAWEYPKVPAEVDFQSLLVPTVDSTRALAIIHHLQVGKKSERDLVCLSERKSSEDQRS